MPMQMIVSPAGGVTDRRPPERFAKNAADHPAGDGTDRTGDKKAGSRPGAGTDPVGPRARSAKHGDRQRGRDKSEVPHLPIPNRGLVTVAAFAYATSRP